MKSHLTPRTVSVTAATATAFLGLTFAFTGCDTRTPPIATPARNVGNTPPNTSGEKLLSDQFTNALQLINGGHLRIPIARMDDVAGIARKLNVAAGGKAPTLSSDEWSKLLMLPVWSVDEKLYVQLDGKLYSLDFNASQKKAFGEFIAKFCKALDNPKVSAASNYHNGLSLLHSEIKQSGPSAGENLPGAGDLRSAEIAMLAGSLRAFGMEFPAVVREGDTFQTKVTIVNPREPNTTVYNLRFWESPGDGSMMLGSDIRYGNATEWKIEAPQTEAQELLILWQKIVEEQRIPPEQRLGTPLTNEVIGNRFLREVIPSSSNRP